MVEPSSLADTVTPPSFSPDAALIAPVNDWSAACASDVAANPVTTAATLVNSMLRTLVMGVLPLRNLVVRSARSGWRWHCPHIRNDRVDFRILQIVLEGGHARRAVGDVLAHNVVVAIGGGLVERWAVGLGVERDRQVADATGLRED